MELFINGKEIYLTERLEPNFTYRFLDSLSPSAVKSGYSKTVTLPACAQNTEALSPFQERYDWVLYEGNRILEQGYCTLDDEEEEGFRKDYHLTLYGGLGSFFYNLKGEDNNPKTLNDICLGFGESLEEDNAFSQSLTPGFVYQGWRDTGSVSDILKLVPCTWKVSAFDYTKTIVNAIGDIFPRSGSGGHTYPSGGGEYLLVTADENTPYAKQDFRIEYMPIAIRYRNIIEGCCRSESNGGYQVHLDPDFFNEDNPYWTDMFLMNTVPGAETSGESEEVEEVYSSFYLDDMDLNQVNQSKYFNPSGSAGEWNYSGSGWLQTSEIIAGNQFLVTITPSFTLDPPPFGNAPIPLRVNHGDSFNSTIDVENEGGERVYGTVAWTHRDVVTLPPRATSGSFATKTVSITIPDGWTKIRFRITNHWDTDNPTFEVKNPNNRNWRNWPVDAFLNNSLVSANLTTVFFNPDEAVLQDPVFSKSKYLSNSKTPLDYLLAYTKMFNLRFYVHPGKKKVDILTFKNYIGTKGVKDISDRIDYGKPYVTTRKLIDAGIINFNLDPEPNVTVQKYFDEEGQNILDRRVKIGESNAIQDYLGNLGVKVGSRSRQESALARRVGSFGTSYLGFNQSAPYTLSYYTSSASGSELVNMEYSLNYINEPSRYDVLEVQDPSNVVVMFAGLKSNPIPESPAIISRNSKDMVRYAGKPCFLGGIPEFMHDGEERSEFGSHIKVTYQLPVFSLTPNYPDSNYGISFANENYDSIVVTSNLFDLYFKDFVDNIYLKPRKVTCWVRLQEPELRRIYWFDDRYWILSQINNYNFNDEVTQCEFIQYQYNPDYA